MQAGVGVVLESLSGAVVTLRGHLGHQDGVTLLNKHNKKRSSETVKAAFYLRKVSLCLYNKVSL